MSNADRMTLARAAEASYGVIPTTPTMVEVRHTGESMKLNMTTQESAEIRADRQLADVKRTDQSAGGGFNFEASYGNLDDIFESLMYSAGWSSIVTVGPGITFSVAAGSGDYTISDSGSGLAGVLVGQWVEIRGYAGANIANNGYAKVTASAAGAITVKGNGDGFTCTAGDTVTIVMGEQLVNGITQSSQYWEKHMPDASGDAYVAYTGYIPEKFSITIEAGSIITGSIEFTGKLEASSATSPRSGTTVAPTNDVMSAVDDIEAILEGYATFATKSFTLEITNNNRNRTQVAALGPQSVGAGQISVSGTLQAYFDTSTEMDKFRNFTDTSISCVAEDTAGNVYIFDIPNLNYTDGQQVAGGKNTDIMEDLTFSAKRHVTEDVTIRIVRFAA